jgi:hypothetical protein
VYTDVNIVMGAESADFFFDCWQYLFKGNLLVMIHLCKSGLSSYPKAAAFDTGGVELSS